MSLGKHIPHPPGRGLDLDLAQLELVNAYRLHTEGLLLANPMPSLPGDASTTLKELCLDSASWVQDQGRQKATRSKGHRHFDGWSPPAMALKANLVALISIQGHLHGHRGHSPWSTQQQMDRDLPDLVATWERSVRRMTWQSQSELDHWLNYSGFPPTQWRTTTLATIRRPGFCDDMIRKVKRKLHGRFRLDLRRQISSATQAREALREQGKLKKVIASILQRDTDLYAL